MKPKKKAKKRVPLKPIEPGEVFNFPCGATVTGKGNGACNNIIAFDFAPKRGLLVDVRDEGSRVANSACLAFYTRNIPRIINILRRAQKTI